MIGLWTGVSSDRVMDRVSDRVMARMSDRVMAE